MGAARSRSHQKNDRTRALSSTHSPCPLRQHARCPHAHKCAGGDGEEDTGQEGREIKEGRHGCGSSPATEFGAARREREKTSGTGSTTHIFSPPLSPLPPSHQMSSSESHTGPLSRSSRQPSNWAGSTAYRNRPPMPPNPRQNWLPSCDLFVTNSSVHPNFL